ncbi:hypothetical protein ACN47E_001292 [Coniothyrium glycines]
MAESSRSSSGASDIKKIEIKTAIVNIDVKIPRRKLTLISITLLLNVLFWSSIFCVIASIFQAVADPNDTTNIAPVVLTLTSAFATIFYIAVHTVFSRKQQSWMHQRQKSSAIKDTSYITIRLAVSLCVLWLITCGWNMIIVARRPVCVHQAPELQGWEFGPTCKVSRAGMAFAMIALVAALTLFISLNTVRRPFEAHIYHFGSRRARGHWFEPLNTDDLLISPGTMEKKSHDRTSTSTSRTIASDMSNFDVRTSVEAPLSTMHAPSPMRSIGMGIFTSSMTPPPIPPAYIASRRAASDETLPHVFHPALAHVHLTRPPRLSGLAGASSSVPLSKPAQYSASAWRAVHPAKPPQLRPSSRSHPQLRGVAYSSRERVSRSSLSLTRPQRLSTASPVECTTPSSRSESAELDAVEDSLERRASPGEIAHAILYGTTIPGTDASPLPAWNTHTRTSSAPDATSGAQQVNSQSRMARGWKPQLPSYGSEQSASSQELNLTKPVYVPLKSAQLTPSRSLGFLSRFSPDTSPDEDEKKPQVQWERQFEALSVKRKPVPARRSWSVESTRDEKSTPAAADPAQAAARMLSRMPRDVRLHKRGLSREEVERKTKAQYEDIKNKPLPRIAFL